MARPAHRHAAVPDGRALTDTEGHNSELLRRYLDEVWGAHRPDAAREFFSASYRRHLSPTQPPLDRDGQLQRLAGFMRAFPDVSLTLHDVIADGDLVAFRSTMRGTHDGEFMGHQPTGRRIEVALLDMVRVTDGRFSEHWGGPDLHDLVRQLAG